MRLRRRNGQERLGSTSRSVVDQDHGRYDQCFVAVLRETVLAPFGFGEGFVVIVLIGGPYTGIADRIFGKRPGPPRREARVVDPGPRYGAVKNRIPGQMRKKLRSHVIAAPVVATQVEDEFPGPGPNLREGIVESLEEPSGPERADLQTGHIAGIPRQPEILVQFVPAPSGQRKAMRILPLLVPAVDEPHGTLRTIRTPEKHLMRSSEQVEQQLLDRKAAPHPIRRCRDAQHHLSELRFDGPAVHGEEFGTGRQNRRLVTADLGDNNMPSDIHQPQGPALLEMHGGLREIAAVADKGLLVMQSGAQALQQTIEFHIVTGLLHGNDERPVERIPTLDPEPVHIGIIAPHLHPEFRQRKEFLLGAPGRMGVSGPGAAARSRETTPLYGNRPVNHRIALQFDAHGLHRRFLGPNPGHCPDRGKQCEPPATNPHDATFF